MPWRDDCSNPIVPGRCSGGKDRIRALATQLPTSSGPVRPRLTTDVFPAPLAALSSGWPSTSVIRWRPLRCWSVS